MFLFQTHLLVNTFLIIFINAYGINAINSSPAFDQDLYKSVLDPEECQKQLTYLRNNITNLRNQFIDASWRFPRSFTSGNLQDYGSYFQCLDISEIISEDMHIGGKYVSLSFALADLEIPTFPSNITWPPDFDGPDGGWPDIPWPDFIPSTTVLTDSVKEELLKYEQVSKNLKRLFAREEAPAAEGDSEDVGFRMSAQLAVCIPKVCTAREALDSFTGNLTQSLKFTEDFVRLPNDKPWAPADTVAVVILSIIGLITILSSAYDIRHTILLGRDPKKANKIYQSFSVYTNTKNFFIFTDNPSAVHCLEGIRSLAMIWVIVGHTFSTQTILTPENIMDVMFFLMEFSSLWISSASITVDTFFMISGVLVVYTTAAKVSRMSLIRNLHLFYLNRLLRMFPILAFTVLMTSSFLYRLADGPHFYVMTMIVDDCRNYWWSTFLYIQNFYNHENMCLTHTWYLAIDMQLYLFAPVVLFFVLGQRKWSAWSAIVGTLLAVVTASTIYNFLNNFHSAMISLARPNTEYMQGYYFHTLPRAAPFFVGMIFGYLLHLYRGKRVYIPIPLVLCLWVLSLSGLFAVICVTYWTIQPDWENQVIDNLLNSFMRPIWAACIGWIIFGCAKGFGGPINWFLSLHIFKILGRLSYALYILHYPLMFLLRSTALAPPYFSWSFSIHQFFTDFSVAVIAAFCVTILIDSPFANLIKMAIGTGPKKRPEAKEKPSISSGESQSDIQPVEDITDEDLKKTKM